MTRTRITARAQLSSRPTVIAEVASACRLVGSAQAGGAGRGNGLDLSRPFDAEFVSAFSEIFNNIVLHSYAGGSDEEIVIELLQEADRLVVRITDRGAPFDPAATEPPDLELLPEGGMGIFIARSFLDEARYVPGPPNQWTLEKCYRSADAPSTTSTHPNSDSTADS